MKRTSTRPSARSAWPPLKRALGQHHLRDGRLCRPLVEYLQLETSCGVVEIGPGGGVLTRELLARGVRVGAIELDPAWAFALRSRIALEWEPVQRGASGERGGRPARLTIVVADALDIEWSRLPVGWRVAGNLPYNVGTPIVERLLAGAPIGTRAGFLLQREVVERMVARPGDDAYGALSLLVAIRARAERLAILRPGSFVPPPKVDSAFVGLEVVEPPLSARQLPELERLIRVAFAQRRKSLRNSLAAGYGRAAADAALAAAGIAPSRRAEQLGLREFMALRSALESR